MTVAVILAGVLFLVGVILFGRYVRRYERAAERFVKERREFVIWYERSMPRTRAWKPEAIDGGRK